MSKPTIMKKAAPIKKPTASLNIEGYYICSREETKELFQPFILLDGMYLVRPSESQGALYTLSVTKDRKVYNYRILQEDKLFLIQERTEKFIDVQDLIQTYKQKPINPQLNIKLVAPLVQGTKRKQNSMAFLTNYSKTQDTVVEDIPGLHRFLPRSEIKNVMEAYMNKPGTFLLRPSLTTEGNLTLTVVHKFELLNFKITQDPNTREVCVSSKKFANFHELLEFYKFNPLKLRSRPNDNVLLTFPLPVDKNLENIHKQAQDELYSELAAVQPLPAEWTEHFDEKHQKNYYYNGVTKEAKWSKPLPPLPPSKAPSAGTNAPTLPPARKPLKFSKSAPAIPPPRSNSFSAPSLPPREFPPQEVEDCSYIETGDIMSPSRPDPLEEENYLAVESPTSKLPPVPEETGHPTLTRASSAPLAGKAPTGAKRMSMIKADAETMKEEKSRILREKEEKKEAARKAKDEAKRLKAEEAQRKKQQKEELKRQKEEEKRRLKAALKGPSSKTLPGKLGVPSPPPCVDPDSTTSQAIPLTPSAGSGPLPPPSRVDLDPTLSPSTPPAKSGPPPPPPRVDLDPTLSPSTPSAKSGPPPPPSRVDLDPTLSPSTPPAKSGPPPPPPRVDLDPTLSPSTPSAKSGPPPPPPRVDTSTQLGPPSPPSRVDLDPTLSPLTPPAGSDPPDMTTQTTDNVKQSAKERKAAEKQKKQEEERLKKEASKREKEEAKRKKEEEKRERRMSKSSRKSISSELASKNSVPASPPPPPVGNVRTTTTPDPTTEPSELLSPLTTSLPAPPPLPSSGPAPPPPPISTSAPTPPPKSAPAPPPPPPVPTPATAPPPKSAPAPPPPPPISPVPNSSTSNNPASQTSSGFSADDLIAGRSKLTAVVTSSEDKPTQQKAGGLGGIMQSVFDQFNDKIGAMRSFVEYSDDEDFEELEEDEDWD